jgi:ABC-type nitrate/sulfonate/bicarbonate transport system substrate-binding protein
MGKFGGLARMAVAACMAMIAESASAQTLTDVTIALSSSSLAASGTRVADGLGLFAKHGLKPKFVIMNSSSDALAGLLSHSVDVVVAGTPEMITAHAHGQTQVVAIATSFYGFPASLVLAKSVADKLGLSPTAPIGERLKALDGLVIATPSPVTIGTVTIKNAAHAFGATIRWTNISQPAMQAAMESGAVQGYLGSAPYWAYPVIKGDGVLWISGPKGDLPTELSPEISSQVETLRGFAESHRDEMTALADVLNDFAKVVRDRPADVEAAISKLYPDLDQKTVDLLFSAESHGWLRPIATPADMEREIKLVEASGTPLPDVGKLDPKAMLFP